MINRNDLKIKEHIDHLLKNGIQSNDILNLDYFTGYNYKTLYDWDQYFEGLVLLYTGWGTEYQINGIKIFLENQKDDGFICRLVNTIVGYCGQEDKEMVKPFLCQIALMCYKADNDLSWLDERYYIRLKKYLKHWLFDLDENNNGLSFWRSGAHTGMDTQHERAGYWNDNISEGVDLNTYLYRECIAFSKLAELLGKTDDKAEFEKYADDRRQAVLSLWDENDGIFYDKNAKTNEVIKVKSLSGLMPMWAGIASAEQVRRMVYNLLLNPNEFLSAYPFPAYAKSEKGYSEDYLPGDIGCNWRGNTWVPTNYMMMQGLIRYGYTDIAKFVAYKTMELINKAGDREYYTSEAGNGCGLDPFWGWSLLGYFMEYEAENKFNSFDLDLPSETFKELIPFFK